MAKLVTIHSEGAPRDVPPIFTMWISEDVHLVFEATTHDDGTYRPDYAVYAVTAAESDRVFGDWPALKKGLIPRGHVPAADVEIDEDTRAMRLMTYGLEQFARL